jgi:hypothetical protein
MLSLPPTLTDMLHYRQESLAGATIFHNGLKPLGSAAGHFALQWHQFLPEA